MDGRPKREQIFCGFHVTQEFDARLMRIVRRQPGQPSKATVMRAAIEQFVAAEESKHQPSQSTVAQP